VTEQAILETVKALQEKSLSDIVATVNAKHNTQHTRISIAAMMRNLSPPEPEEPAPQGGPQRIRMTSFGAYNHCQWPTDHGGKCRKQIGDKRIRGVENYCVEHQLKALNVNARHHARRMLGVK